MTPSRPYFIRALYDWIVDNRCTPYLQVDATMTGVSVPTQHIKEVKIVLNIAPEAIMNLSMNNDWVNFEARFSGVSHIIRLPVMSIQAVYAAENGRGMVFNHEPTEDNPPHHEPPTYSGGHSSQKSNKPSLKVIK